MKLSSTLLGAIAVAQADDHPDLFGTCVKDEKTARVLPIFLGDVNSVEECIAGCRTLQRDPASYGYAYAGLEFKTECYCGDEPEGGFDSLYTWPDRCNMRCGGEGAIWQNCGGAGAMNVWSVPKSDLGGVCVYDHPRDGRVFNGPAEIGITTLTVEHCRDYCFGLDYNYYGLEYGDSCYCGNNPSHIVPALPTECAMPCTGDDTELCGSAYRLNAYGPSFEHIKANHVVFQHATVHKYFQVNIDLKLDDNTANTERSNIYGLMTENGVYPNIGSQIPAVFLKSGSMTLEVCMFFDATQNCVDITTITADTWFNLKVEQNCWNSGTEYCYISVLIDDVLAFFWYNSSPEIFYDVSGVIGNTYKQPDIVAASGKYMNFNLEQTNDGSDGSVTFQITAEPDANNANNA
jgi:hypothetical protein